MTAQVVCAWCDDVIKEGDQPTTHGICPPCLDEQLAEVADTQDAHAQRQAELLESPAFRNS